jgi:hypothetical protein
VAKGCVFSYTPAGGIYALGTIFSWVVLNNKRYEINVASAISYRLSFTGGHL